MISREKLSSYLHQFLDCATVADYAPNGIQVEGKQSIRRILTAVTASNHAIEAAIQWHADALLVHHGYFWKGENPVITGMKRQRIGKLLIQDINLFAYHLPLDIHPTLGNNACLAQRLNIEAVQQHAVNSINNLLWSGELASEMTTEQLSRFIEKQLNRPPLHLTCAKKSIRSIAWCSGAAQDYIEKASFLGVDAYLSGEVSERTYYQAKELGIHYFACGHHATERYGIEALGNHLAEQFDLEHQFIDSDNPV